MKNKENILVVKQKTWYVYIIILILFSKYIVFFAINIHFLPEKYLFYFNNNSKYIGMFNSTNLLRIFYKLMWIFLFAKSFFRNKKANNNVDSIPCILLIIDLVLYIFSIKYTIFNRFSIILFESVLLLYNNNLIKNIKVKSNRLILYTIIILLLIVNFYLVIVKKSNTIGGYQTYPYIFEDDYNC